MATCFSRSFKIRASLSIGFTSIQIGLQPSFSIITSVALVSVLSFSVFTTAATAFAALASSSGFRSLETFRPQIEKLKGQKNIAGFISTSLLQNCKNHVL
jgi:hypothetical protein